MKQLLVLLAILAMFVNANFAFADVSTDVDTNVGPVEANAEANVGPVTSESESSVDFDAALTNQQQQQQEQELNNTNNIDVDAEVGDVSADNSFSYYAEAKRNHITASGIGNFVGAPAAMPDNWKPFVCQPLHSVYTKERLNNSKKVGSFSDRKGSFTHKLGSSSIKKVVYKPFKGTPDDRPIILINWELVGDRAYATDELLGEFECEGYYGWPRGAALGQCLAEAKAKTNTNRVVAYYKMRRDPKNSGMSLGSGASGSILGGAGGDAVAGAMSLSGLIGTTTAYVDEATDWYVLALNDGPLTPPYPLTCDLKPIEPPPPPVVEPRPEPVCDPTPIYKEIEDLKVEISQCKVWGINNLGLRFKKATKFIDLAECTGENGYYSDVIKDFELAEKNYFNGDDIKANKVAADEILYKVYYNWAFAMRQTKGSEKEYLFVQDKQVNSEKLTSMPDSYKELKH